MTDICNCGLIKQSKAGTRQSPAGIKVCGACGLPANVGEAVKAQKGIQRQPQNGTPKRTQPSDPTPGTLRVTLGEGLCRCGLMKQQRAGINTSQGRDFCRVCHLPTWVEVPASATSSAAVETAAASRPGRVPRTPLMQYCHRCGQRLLAADARFCSHCGAAAISPANRTRSEQGVEARIGSGTVPLAPTSPPGRVTGSQRSAPPVRQPFHETNYSTRAVIAGLIGIVLGWFPIIGWCAILAIVWGVKGANRAKAGSSLNDLTMSRVGMWLGIAAVCVYGFIGLGLAVTGQL